MHWPLKQNKRIMLTSRTILLNVKRKFSDSPGLLTVESLCNDENRTKCIEKMKSATKNISIKQHPSTRMASVFIPLVNCDKLNGEPSLLYTLRSNKLRKHISQVSFPGGILEENDASYTDCALRETEEEIGITRDRVTVWGQTSLVHLRNVPAIMPVVGMIHDYRSDLLKINDQEVERVFTVPISEMCRKRGHTQFRMVPRNTRDTKGTSFTLTAAYSIPVYPMDGMPRIWGMTAFITHLFLSSLLPSDFYEKQIPYISKYK